MTKLKPNGSPFAATQTRLFASSAALAGSRAELLEKGRRPSLIHRVSKNQPDRIAPLCIKPGPDASSWVWPQAILAGVQSDHG